MKNIIFVFFLFPFLLGNIYYVASSGGNYTNITEVNSATQVSGDSVLFKRGEYFNDARLICDSGNSSGYITYGAYGTGENPILNISGQNNIISTYQKSYIKLENLHIIGGSQGGITLYQASNIIIDACEIDNSTKGTYGASIDNFDIHDITINNCSIHDNSDDGIWFNFGDDTIGENGMLYNITLTNNTIYNNVNGIYVRQIALAQDGTENEASNIKIDNNTIYSNSKYGISFSETNNIYGNQSINFNNIYNNGGINNCNGIWLGGVSYATIENNNIHDNNSSDIDGVGIFLDSSKAGDNYGSHDCIVRNNICYNHDSVHNQTPWSEDSAGNSAGIALYGGIYNCSIYNNILYGNAHGLFIHSAPNQKTYNNNIFHNTIVNNRLGIQTHIISGDTGNNNFIKNNIISNNNLDGDGVTTNWEVYEEGVNIITFDYNNYFNSDYQFFCNNSNYTSIAAYQSATGQDLHSIASDPLLSSRYRLLPGSPCINAGATLGVADDYLGNWRDLRPDIGAMEAGDFIHDATLHDAKLN